MAKQVTLIDKSCNKVIYADSDGHFVDILFSFLTLPLSSILQLTKQSVGSMNNLLQSVQSLDSVCFSSEACRSMLLCPSNSASNLARSLPIKYDNISNLFHSYYTCSSCSCNHLSFYANAHCTCGGLMTRMLEFVADAPSSNAYSSVFFNAAFKFTITDDLHVSQTSVEFFIEQLPKLDIKQMSSLESVSVDVTVENIIELLKQLLVSDTPLTDVFLGVHEKKDKLKVAQQTVHAKCDETEAPNTSTRNISLKLYVNKEEDTTVIAEANNDFADLLFGFLTYPMGALIGKLGGQSGIRCMDNLYNSVEPLKPANCYRDSELIGKLLNPKLPPYFKTKNQLIKLDEETQTQRYYRCFNNNCHYSTEVGNKRCNCSHYWAEKHTDFNLIDPKRSSNGDYCTMGGYMRISRYMFTDDLVITQPSSYMIITDILGKAAGKKIHVRNFEIGEHEALALLRASINSENVLTDVLLGVERGSRRFRSY